MQQLFFFIFYKYKHLFERNILINAGRNFRGRICVQHQGGRYKSFFIKIDRFRFLNLYGFILRILDNFFVTGFLGIIVYLNGLVGTILLSEGIKKSSVVFSGFIFKNFLPVGSTQKLRFIKLFDYINSVEIFPVSGAIIARAAGTSVKIIAKDAKFVFLKLNSG
jgi:large subunit ribosomal protein L2